MTGERRDFLRRGAAALLATLLLAPAVGPLLPGQPFHRVMSRVFLLSIVVAFTWGSGPVRAWPARLRALGLSGPERGRRFGRGLLLGVSLLAFLLLLSWGSGGRALSDGSGMRPLPVHLALAAASALVISLLEEVLCRGYLLRAIGGFGSALVYAAVHYLRPPEGSAPAASYDPLLAVETLPALFRPFADPRTAILGVGSLFAFGLALNAWKRRTGTLYFGIGLHAGLVFALSLYPRWLRPDPSGSVWIFGGNRVHDGLLGLAALLLLWRAAARR